MNFWIELSTVLVEVALFLYFFSLYFERAEKPHAYQYIVIVGYGVVLFLASYYFPASLPRTLLNIILIICTAKLYCKQPWKKILYPSLLLVVSSLIADALCGSILTASGLSYDAIMGTGAGRIAYNSMGKIMCLLFLFIILSLMKSRNVNRKSAHIPLLVLCQVLSCIVCYQNFTAVSNRTAASGAVIFESLFLLYINIVICAYVEILNRSYARQQEAVLAKQQMEVRESYYHDMVQRQEETRKLWHDIKKYMAAMESLISHENRDEARQCLEAVRASFAHIENTIDTGNSLIDSIFTYGMNKAEAAGVSLSPRIWVDKALNIPASDLFIIIGNTMDNAIEACSLLEEPEEKTVFINLYQKNHVLFYEIKNAYRNGKKKKSGKIHGYGLQNVNTCVERNDGNMSIASDAGQYVVSIRLNV